MTPTEVDETIGRMARNLSEAKKKLVCCEERLRDRKRSLSSVVFYMQGTLDHAGLHKACQDVDWDAFVAALGAVVETKEEISRLTAALKEAGVDVR